MYRFCVFYSFTDGCECFLLRAWLSGSHCVLSRYMTCCTSWANKDDDEMIKRPLGTNEFKVHVKFDGNLQNNFKSYSEEAVIVLLVTATGVAEWVDPTRQQSVSASSACASQRHSSDDHVSSGQRKHWRYQQQRNVSVSDKPTACPSKCFFDDQSAEIWSVDWPWKLRLWEL